jgi:hypothetical protein
MMMKMPLAIDRRKLLGAGLSAALLPTASAKETIMTTDPKPFWPNGARLAVSFSLMFEAGGQPISGAGGVIPDPGKKAPASTCANPNTSPRARCLPSDDQAVAVSTKMNTPPRRIIFPDRTLRLHCYAFSWSYFRAPYGRYCKELKMLTRTFCLSVLFILAAQSGSALACDSVNTCKDIAWCMIDSNGHEFSAPLRDVASKGQGDQVGGDASGCQNKYGQHSNPHDWGSVSSGCLNPDFAAMGKKALGGEAACN